MIFVEVTLELLNNVSRFFNFLNREKETSPAPSSIEASDVVGSVESGAKCPSNCFGRYAQIEREKASEHTSAWGPTLSNIFYPHCPHYANCQKPAKTDTKELTCRACEKNFVKVARKSYLILPGLCLAK